MTNAIVKDLLAKNDWDRIIFRFQKVAILCSVVTSTR